MTRTMTTMLCAVGGLVQGMMLFVMFNVSYDAPFDLLLSGAWLAYPTFVFGGVGMICGAVAGWVAHGGVSKDRVYHSVPRRTAAAGAPPYKGPFG